MHLVIDCGNTDTVFGLFDGQEMTHSWRMPSSEEANESAWSYRLASELLEQGVAVDDVAYEVLSSVVPQLTDRLAAAAEQVTGRAPIIVRQDIYDQLNVTVINKQEIGSDLVANAVAAYHRFNQKTIVVDFGTALTFTAILDDGTLAGVAIAPGLKTAVKSLLLHTAQLPEVPLEKPESALGKNTIHAIQAGVVFGYTGMVNNILSQLKSELGADTKVIATGGLSDVLEDVAGAFDAKDRVLTLRGLGLIGEMLKA